MMRNDYRRALILLRCNAQGYGGHVRLERRTMMGSMYFTVQAPEDGASLRAALIGRGKDSYYACPLGELKRDGRGQATLRWSFDPRNVCGRELEQYQLIAVARVSGEDCDGVLYGNVAGHADVNWERVRQALCLSVQDGSARDAQPQARSETAEAAPEEAENTAETSEKSAEEPVETEPVIAKEAEPTEAEPDVAAEAETAQSEQVAATAGERLGVDMALPWPEEIEALRERFAAQQALEDAPQDGFVYIEVPLPEESPFPYLAAGLRAEGGVPVQARYALPAAYAPEPPRGLEEYAWVGDQNRGWWVVEVGL